MLNYRTLVSRKNKTMTVTPKQFTMKHRITNKVESFTSVTPPKWLGSKYYVWLIGHVLELKVGGKMTTEFWNIVRDK
jgi:hypothetical protein